MSRVTTPSSGPTTTATARAERPDTTRATAARATASTGRRRKAPGVSRSGRVGATRANHTRASESTVAPAATPRRQARGARCRGGRPLAVAPEPPHVAAERLGEQGQRDQHDGRGQRGGQHVGDGHRERDPHRRGHHLAPVPELERRAQPRQAPPGDGEGVAHQARGQHPPPDRRCGGDAEHEDEERVDLAVEPAPERRDRAGAPGHPAVDGIEGEGRDAEREQGRCHRVAGQQLDGEGRDRAGQQRPAQGDEVGRPQQVGVGREAATSPGW